MHNLLASGYVPATGSFLVYLNVHSSFRSKDGVVNLWNLPDPPSIGLDFAEAPGEPIALENVSRAQQGDITSLDWNSEGTLLALGSYDSVLRVCTNQGSVYLSHPQHQVGEYFKLYLYLGSDCSRLILRRAPYLQRGSRKMVHGYCRQVLMEQYVYGT